MEDSTVRAICEMVVALCAVYTTWNCHRNGEATARVEHQVKNVPTKTIEKLVEKANGEGILPVSPEGKASLQKQADKLLE